MDKRIVEDYFNGNTIKAYKIFGAHLGEEKGIKGVWFRTYAPHAIAIHVVGDFNEWKESKKYEMKRCDDRGIYELFVAGIKEGMLYKYRICQATKNVVDKSDPYAFYQEYRPQTASIVTNIKTHRWKDKDWLSTRDINWNKPMNIYEVHLGSWRKKSSDERINYQEIAAELIAYVKANHFTHIEFMPLNEYPFDGSWGYQSSGYFCVTSRYGTCKELVYLINACHAANIGVIIDFVPVHFVKDEFALGNYDGTPLYEYDNEKEAISEWGSYNFNVGKNEVRSFLMSAAAFWMEIYHFDGIRMDAISNMIYWRGNKDLGENSGALEFLKRMNTNLKRSFPQVMLIAEDSSAFPNVTQEVARGGLGFDYKWDLGWMNDTLSYLEKDPIHRKWHHHQITFSMDYFYSERFLAVFSHDEVVHGKHTILNKMWGSYEEQFAQLKTLYLYMFTHPGKKLNFMGNEIAHFREWDEERSCDWELLTYPSHDSFAHYFRDLCALYTSQKRLYECEYDRLSFRWIDAVNEDENLFVYARCNAKGEYIIILNFSPNEYIDHSFKANVRGKYTEVINTNMEKYGGQIPTPQKIKYDGDLQEITLNIPAFGGILISVENPKKVRS